MISKADKEHLEPWHFWRSSPLCSSRTSTKGYRHHERPFENSKTLEKMQLWTGIYLICKRVSVIDSLGLVSGCKFQLLYRKDTSSPDCRDQTMNHVRPWNPATTEPLTVKECIWLWPCWCKFVGNANEREGKNSTHYLEKAENNTIWAVSAAFFHIPTCYKALHKCQYRKGRTSAFILDQTNLSCPHMEPWKEQFHFKVQFSPSFIVEKYKKVQRQSLRLEKRIRCKLLPHHGEVRRSQTSRQKILPLQTPITNPQDASEVSAI